MEIQEAFKDLDREISEMDPLEAIQLLEDLHRALPHLIFLMKLSLYYSTRALDRAPVDTARAPF